MEWERIVNRHADAKRSRKSKRYHNKVITSLFVAIAFLIASVCNLVNPVLGTAVVVVSLMNGCYCFGVVKGRVDNA